MKHIIALVFAGLAAVAIIFMWNLDQKANKFAHIQQIIAKSKQEVKLNVTQPTKKQIEKPKESEEEKKLKMLKDKAGNMAAFEVSPLYKRKCSSCHGVNGKGIIGPRLIGKSENEVLQALQDFKSGKRKNYVMFGLLNNMKEDELKALAKEIGTFEQKLKNAK
jgi:cytochrome c553